MPEQLPCLLPKSVLSNRWEVVHKLGEGGFGAVYLVLDKLSNERCAMKVELAKSKLAVLQLEAHVLQEMQNKTHALKFYKIDTFGCYRYIVMQLAGRNLCDLRRALPKQKFTLNTTVRLVMQCVNATRELHEIGFLHRDIKPANFAIGRGQYDSRILYMLDFGLARNYLTKNGELRPPRDKCGFRGTLRYASPNAHFEKELGRHDDIYCIMYTAVEVRLGSLKWRELTTKEDVGAAKVSISPSDLFGDMPHEFHYWYEALKKLTYMDKPDYDWFNGKMQKIMDQRGYKEESPYDWEEGGDSFMHTVINPALDNPYESQMREQKEAHESHSKRG